MRTLTAAQQAVFDRDRYGFRWRVQVKDSGGTWRDLSSYPGFNACVGASIKTDVDADVWSASIELRRAVEDASLAGLMTGSPLNRAFVYPGTYAALLEPGREVKVDLAYVGADQQAEAGDWVNLFHGDIDSVDDASDPIRLECRDLGRRLQDRFIEVERVYGAGPTAAGVRIWKAGETYALNELIVPADPNGHYYKVTTAGTAGNDTPTWNTGAGSTTASGTCVFTQQGTTSTSGTAIETMIQAILDDTLGAGAVSLYTPVASGWAVKSWLQSRDPVGKPPRMLAEQRGWSVRYRYDTGSSSWRYTLYGPDRTKTAADQTFSAGRVKKTTQTLRDLSRVRNRIKVFYWDSADLWPDGRPKRKSVLVENLTSQTKYGIRYMEVAEEESSHLDTLAEATAFSDAMLSDLADPELGLGVEVACYPFADLGDLYEFAADGRRFSASQKLAVVGITHALRGGREQTCRTQLQLAGKPSAGIMRHLEKEARPGVQQKHELQLWTGGIKSTALSEVVGGARVRVSANLDKLTKWEGNEIHISTTSGFTPSSSTLKARGRFNDAEIADLIPGVTYYVKIRPFGWNDSKPVFGEYSTETSFVAGHARPQHLDPDGNMLPLPPNGDFAGMMRGTGSPPDRWSVETGSWASGGADIYFRTDDAVRSGLRAIEFGTRVEASTLLSDYLPVLPGHVYAVEMWANPSNTAQTPKLEVVWYSAKGTTISTSTLSRTPTATGYYLTAYNVASPSTAKWARLRIGKTTASANTVIVDDVRMRPLGDKWHEVGTTGEPAFQGTAPNDWQNFGAPHETVAFMRDALGFVHLRGLAKTSGGGAGNPPVGTTIFTLPPGYRPRARVTFPCIGGGNVMGRINVDSNGNVSTEAGLGNSTGFALESCHFMADV